MAVGFLQAAAIRRFLRLTLMDRSGGRRARAGRYWQACGIHDPVKTTVPLPPITQRAGRENGQGAWGGGGTGRPMLLPAKGCQRHRRRRSLNAVCLHCAGTVHTVPEKPKPTSLPPGNNCVRTCYRTSRLRDFESQLRDFGPSSQRVACTLHCGRAVRAQCRGPL